MDDRKVAEALAVEIARATAAGDLDHAEKLANLLRNVIARVKGETLADASTGDLLGVPQPSPGQLAPIARRISTEALSAELAAERGDWDTVRATYERLAMLFAEYRLIYVQCLRSQ
jgi:hypothetical protein